MAEAGWASPRTKLELLEDGPEPGWLSPPKLRVLLTVLGLLPDRTPSLCWLPPPPRGLGSRLLRVAGLGSLLLLPPAGLASRLILTPGLGSLLPLLPGLGSLLAVILFPRPTLGLASLLPTPPTWLLGLPDLGSVSHLLILTLGVAASPLPPPLAAVLPPPPAVAGHSSRLPPPPLPPPASSLTAPLVLVLSSPAAGLLPAPLPDLATGLPAP